MEPGNVQMNRDPITHWPVVVRERSKEEVERDIISGKIVDAAVKVHKRLGPGLLENVYEACLAYELTQKGLEVRRQVVVPITYDKLAFDEAYRLDLLVEDRIIIEVKTVGRILPIHKAQLLTYMKLSGRKLGILLSFNKALMREGISRLIL